MKKVLALLSLMSFLVLSVQAQDAPNAAAESNEAYPVMEFETTTIDYGKIKRNSEPYRIFKFTNTGDAPLIISKAKGSCGCTVPTYPKEAIAPGESAEVKVRYDTNRFGNFTKSVTLTTNEKTPTRKLTIKGQVFEEVVEEAIPASGSGF